MNEIEKKKNYGPEYLYTKYVHNLPVYIKKKTKKYKNHSTSSTLKVISNCWPQRPSWVRTGPGETI